MSPARNLITEIRRNCRFLPHDYADLAFAEPVDAGAVLRDLRAALNEAESFIGLMPAGKEGLAFLKGGRVVQPDPSQLAMYTEHAGSRGGHWPSSSEITGAMLDRKR